MNNLLEAVSKIANVQITQTEAFLNVNNAIDDREKKLDIIAESYEGEDISEFVPAEIVQEGIDTSKLRVIHNYNEKVRGKMDLRIEELSTMWDSHNDKIKSLRDEQAKLNDEIIKIAKNASSGNSEELKKKLDEQRDKYSELTKTITEEQKKMLEIDKQLRTDYDKLYSRLVKIPGGAPTKGTQKAADEKWRPGLNKAYDNEARTKKELEESEKKDSDKKEEKKEDEKS